MADTDNEYELLRQRRIEANHAKLASLNLLPVKVDIVPCKVVKSLPVTQPAAPRSLPLSRLMTDDTDVSARKAGHAWTKSQTKDSCYVGAVGEN